MNRVDRTGLADLIIRCSCLPTCAAAFFCSAQRDSTAIHSVIQHTHTHSDVTPRGRAALDNGISPSVQTEHLHNNGCSHAGQTKKIYWKSLHKRMQIKFKLILKDQFSLKTDFNSLSYPGVFHWEPGQHPHIHLSRTSPSLGV